MNFWQSLPIGIGLAAFALSNQKAEDSLVVVLSGDTLGYLAPCGCTFPMSGGIKRKASAIEAMTRGKPSLVLENGGIVSTGGRQSELKAETVAEAMKYMHVDAAHLTPEEAALGSGMALSIGRLSEGKLITSSLDSPTTVDVKPGVVEGELYVGAVSTRPEALATRLGEKALALDEAVRSVLDSAKSLNKRPVLMLDGNEAQARALAAEYPELALIQYRSGGNPPPQPIKAGNTLLATPGERGRNIVRLSYRAGKFEDYAVVGLGPEIHDHPDVTRLYKNYLGRVREEGLLDKLPRTETPGFAGTKTCGSCHAEAMAVWAKSKHSHALETLEKEDHDADPDCVACHVVALGSTKGFRSRKETPELADVGCESCHGPGLEHSLAPYKRHLLKVGKESCLPCHTPHNSPGFDFATYWPKVSHK